MLKIQLYRSASPRNSISEGLEWFPEPAFFTNIPVDYDTGGMKTTLRNLLLLKILQDNVSKQKKNQWLVCKYEMVLLGKNLPNNTSEIIHLFKLLGIIWDLGIISEYSAKTGTSPKCWPQKLIDPITHHDQF